MVVDLCDSRPDRSHLAGDGVGPDRPGTVSTTAAAALDLVCGLAAAAIDGTEHAGVTVVQGAQFITWGASDDIARMVDRIQSDTGQGPCVEAIRMGETVVSDDLLTDPRWPQFRARVVDETGIRSMQCHRMFLRADAVGVLTLFAGRADAFPEWSRPLGSIFAAHAAVAMQAAPDQDCGDRLDSALAASRRVGAAVGILMCREELSEAAAGQWLRGRSHQTGRSVHDIADDIVTAVDRIPR